MKIRVATIIWRGGGGGAERSVLDLAAVLDRDKFDMRFFFLGEAGPFAEEIASLGYPVENLCWRNGYSLAGRWRLLNALRRFKPMLVHDHTIAVFTPPLVKLVCRCPILHTEHGRAMRHAAGEEIWRCLIDRFDLHFCDRILANSYMSKMAVQQAYGVPEAKIQVVYLGIDLQKFASPSSSVTNKFRYRIGFVGRILHSSKGVNYLPHVARALLDMGRQDVELVVVGDGPDRLMLENLCKQLDVFHLFTFMGWCTDVRPLLSTFDVLLIPSRFESFGLSALEALALGVRVVGFDVGGLREAVRDCPAAQLVPPGDVQAMASAIVSVLDLPQTRSQNSRAYVEEHFSSQRMVLDIQEIYEEYAF